MSSTPAEHPAIAAHQGGKMAIRSTIPLANADDLSIAYTPGVAEVCRAIAADAERVDELTWRGNVVAVVSDGTAVLGLGNIGPRAAMPVMEGKALLFKTFADVDAVPICLDSTDVDTLVETVALMAPSFGGVNLEDISAPRCFEIERRLRERLDIPVFHDDQHGTAIVVTAALINASRVIGKNLSDLTVVIVGAGAAGDSVARMIVSLHVKDVLVLDRQGILAEGRIDMPYDKAQLAAITNHSNREGTLADAIVGADVLIGLSGGVIPEELLATMNPGGAIFALANPDPEVHPEVAARYAAVVATGRSDFPNQINNVLAFPGVFRGALDVRATTITESMKQAAAKAIADLIDEPSASMIVPSPFDERVAPAVAAAVAAAAVHDGVARRTKP